MPTTIEETLIQGAATELAIAELPPVLSRSCETQPSENQAHGAALYPSPADLANGGNHGGNHRAAKESNGTKAVVQQWPILMLPVDQIAPNPFQPRQEFDEEELEELAASVREHGVLQPVLVRSCAVSGYAREKYPTETKVIRRGREETVTLLYHLVAGERRLRASQKARRQFIPAIVRDDLSDAQVAELAVVENVQRANLTPIEEARGYKRLMIEFRLKEERIAKKVGKSVQTVRDTLKLLALPLGVQKLLLTRKLNASHGQALLKLAPFEQVCSLVAHKAAESGLTATALGENVLPNARELKGKSLLIELDYKTKFDWKSVCRECPHKAYVASGYSSYCLQPLEWQRKQNEAIELQKSEAARVLEAARQQRQGGSQGDGQGGGDNPITLDQLPHGSYRDLSYLGVDRLPAGCSGVCPCRSAVCDSRDPTKVRPICLDPQRFTGLQQAEREAHQLTRQRQFAALWEQAKELLEAQVESGSTGLCAALALWALFMGEHLRYGASDNWQELSQGVANELSLELPWEALYDEEASEAQGMAVLREYAANELLQFMACLVLAQEAQGAVRWGQPTPLLFAVLGHEEAQQGELTEELEGEPENASVQTDEEEPEEREGGESLDNERGDFESDSDENDSDENDSDENDSDENDSSESEETYWGTCDASDEPYFVESDSGESDRGESDECD